MWGVKKRSMQGVKKRESKVNKSMLGVKKEKVKVNKVCWA